MLDPQERLKKALDESNDDLIRRLSCDLFFDKNHKPDREASESFSDFADCEISFRYVADVRTHIGRLTYKGKKYLFS